jgi:hypothetical protein
MGLSMVRLRQLMANNLLPIRNIAQCYYHFTWPLAVALSTLFPTCQIQNGLGTASYNLEKSPKISFTKLLFFYHNQLFILDIFDNPQWQKCHWKRLVITTQLE